MSRDSKVKRKIELRLCRRCKYRDGFLKNDTSGISIIKKLLPLQDQLQKTALVPMAKVKDCFHLVFGFSRYTQRAGGFLWSEFSMQIANCRSILVLLQSALCNLPSALPISYLVPHFRNTFRFWKRRSRKYSRLYPSILQKNQRYDQLTRQVIQELCRAEEVTVDVGCHKGEILDLFLKYAPNGSHRRIWAYPRMFQNCSRDMPIMPTVSFLK